jgi:hypothetical protein
MRENENIFVSIHLGVYHWLMNNFGFSHLFAGKPHIYFGFKKTSLTPGLLFGFLSINLKSCGFVQMRFIRTLPTYPCRRIGHLRWLIVKRSLHVYVSAKKNCYIYFSTCSYEQNTANQLFQTFVAISSPPKV